MFKKSTRANKLKRLRTEVNLTEQESSFADMSIPLTLSSLPENIMSDDSLPSPSSCNEESQSGDKCNHDIWEMLHFPGESCNEDELALDSMWNEVCGTLIAQTDERELRHWETKTTQEDHDSDFEEVSEEFTITQTDDPLLSWIRMIKSGVNLQEKPMQPRHPTKTKRYTPGQG